MLHPYQQIPNRPTTFDEKYQGDLDNILSAIDRLYTNSPQLSNQRAQLKLPSKDLLSLDLVISSIERTAARRLDTQRASLPTLVSQGVAAMGWCVESRSSTLEEEGPAELELLDRLERAGSRRYTNQCSPIPPIEQQPSLMTLYTQSMRENDAMEAILSKTGEGRMSNQDALLRKNRLSIPISLATSTLTRSGVELDTATIHDDDMTSDKIGLLQGGQFPAPTPTHRSQSMPNIFKKNKTHTTPPQKRSLFGKKSSNPPNSTSSNPRDSAEDPFRMPSLIDYPLANFLNDISNQDLDTSNDHVTSPDVQQEDLMIEKPDQIRWATEVALRIGTTNVWLWRHDGRMILNESIEYRLDGSDFIEFTVKEVHFPDEVFRVLLPVKIKAEKERKEGLIVFWNEVEDLNKESEMERVKEEFYGVQDWNRNKPDRIDCRRCGNGLKEDLKKIEKYLGLPSEGWEDFVEYWICHETDDHGGYFDGKKKKGDWKRDVRENEGFVGDKFVELKEDLREAQGGGRGGLGWKVKEQFVSDSSNRRNHSRFL
ncbi:uncharacterized protein MELLADRAFT_92911 [Melampsora larici-populina 98AG31]|uniref:Uncharacterized protein n=1 Tax=Melampsora larici-populina (strain 98AG31 / pathotype 3-4-7) TaxID=747676 RepID=F4S384_MELLP|nr:uncharacterized protein MELLADRAFT_92911 [Melampsora larici-populina 98AG31]EGG00940.1 hypothetical protein MELLADRAFT_92911 [Melampsora larici-populina 98AG31]